MTSARGLRGFARGRQPFGIRCRIVAAAALLPLLVEHSPAADPCPPCTEAILHSRLEGAPGDPVEVVDNVNGHVGKLANRCSGRTCAATLQFSHRTEAITAGLFGSPPLVKRFAKSVATLDESLQLEGNIG